MDPEEYNEMIDRITDRMVETLELLAMQPRDAAQNEVLRMILDEFGIHTIDLRVRREDPEWMLVGITMGEDTLGQYAQTPGLIWSEEIDLDELDNRQLTYAVIANLMVGEYREQKGYMRYDINWIGEHELTISVKIPITEEVRKIFGVGL